MALGYGSISIRSLMQEFQTSAVALTQYYRGGGIVPNTARNAGVPTSGPISLAHFRGASYATEGSFYYSSPGFYSFTWPRCEHLTVYVLGSGGGGGGGAAQDHQGHPFFGADGAPGSDSYFQGSGITVLATGGTGGQNNPGTGASDGSPGVGINGDYSQYGGGAIGGYGGQPSIWKGGDGGAGGYAYRTFYRDGPYTPAPGATTTLVVGTGVPAG